VAVLEISLLGVLPTIHSSGVFAHIIF